MTALVARQVIQLAERGVRTRTALPDDGQAVQRQSGVRPPELAASLVQR
jgi:hypothetical protein